MKKAIIPAALLLLTSFTSTSTAAVSTIDELDLFSSLGPLEMWQSADWVSADTFVSSFDTGRNNLDEYEVTYSFLDFVDYQLMPLQSFLEWDHDRYILTVYPEENTAFSVIYFDPYRNLPSDGYPKVSYWTEDGPHSSLPMSLSEIQGGRIRYTRSISIPPGVYFYQYTAKNDSLDEYSLEVSSFITAERPAACTNSGITDASFVSNARIPLKWNSGDGAMDEISYKLFLGTTPDELHLVYEGTAPRFELSSLEYGRQYYWQVEATNKFGITSRSQMYRFSTITPVERAYNYPNPFNPASGQETNILFDMPDRGSAECSIYSELGDLCWQETFYDLPAGANEIVYDGKDDNGRLLYNGTYVCVIKKRFSGKENRDRCRILIIK
ncbi:MAG: fibronectin type III domain-containing protein [Endomicrobiales bacterium]